MKRREFLKTATTGALGVAALTLVGCGSKETAAPGEETAAAGSAEELSKEAAKDQALPELKWEMATSWPVALDTIYGGAQTFAEAVTAMTGGKFTIVPRAAGELAPGLQVLDVVSQGAVPVGHTAAYYYVGKTNAVAFGTARATGPRVDRWLWGASICPRVSRKR